MTICSFIDVVEAPGASFSLFKPHKLKCVTLVCVVLLARQIRTKELFCSPLKLHKCQKMDISLCKILVGLKKLSGANIGYLASVAAGVLFMPGINDTAD